MAAAVPECIEHVAFVDNLPVAHQGGTAAIKMVLRREFDNGNIVPVGKLTGTGIHSSCPARNNHIGKSFYIFLQIYISAASASYDCQFHVSMMFVFKTMPKVRKKISFGDYYLPASLAV